MALSVSNIVNSGSNSFSYTVASGTEALEVSIVGRRVGGFSVTGVTFNGVALTQMKQSSHDQTAAALFVLLSPPVTTANIVVTFSSAPDGFYLSAASVTGGVDIASAIGNTGDTTSAGDDGGSGGTRTASVTTGTPQSEASLYFAVIFNFDNPSYTATTPTPTYNNQTASIIKSSAGYRAAMGSAVALTWSASYGGVSNGSEIIFAELKELVIHPPSVDTLAATDIGLEEATLNGEITDTGGENSDERGFVWSTTSHGDPGDTPPTSSGYEDYFSDSGDFGTGTFDTLADTLTPDTTYYVRAFAHNSIAYQYGPEISFDTDAPPPFRFENLPGVVYDPDDTQTIYAERLNDILERLEALEG